MTAFDCYVIYVAIKAHFSRKKYDYFKYNGRTKASVENFNERKDRYFFEKLAKKYSKEELVSYFVSNFLSNSNLWVGEMNDKNFLDWKRKIQSISYLYENDLKTIIDRCGSLNDAMKCKNSSHSTLIKLYLGDHIMPETMVLLNRITSFIERYDTMLSDSIWIKVSNLLQKYDPFVIVDQDKIKSITYEINTETH